MKTAKKEWILFLALMHRYGFPVLAVLVPMGLRKWLGFPLMLCMGMCFLGMAVYDCLGYKLRWKHWYCSYQHAYHQKMTPDRVQWHTVKKTDAYGIPLVWAVLGIAMLAVHLAW